MGFNCHTKELLHSVIVILFNHSGTSRDGPARSSLRDCSALWNFLRFGAVVTPGTPGALKARRNCHPPILRRATRTNSSAVSRRRSHHAEIPNLHDAAGKALRAAGIAQQNRAGVFDPPGSGFTFPRAINPAGAVMGGFSGPTTQSAGGFGYRVSSGLPSHSAISQYSCRSSSSLRWIISSLGEVSSGQGTRTKSLSSKVLR